MIPLQLILMQLQLLLLAQEQQARETQIKTRMWQLPLITERNLNGKGLYNNLFTELRDGSNPKYCHHDYFRMSKHTFDYILEKIRYRIQRQDTHLRKAIPAEMRLAITLHHLAEGASFTSIKYHWRLGKSTARQIIYETCDAIWDELMPLYLQPPQTEQDWKTIAHGFKEKWDFPLCVGALDGKHVRIQAPPKSGSEYYNYKQYFSINLMAICDADLMFRFVDVGQAGRWSDSGVFEASTYGSSLLNDGIKLPSDEMVNGQRLSYCFVADEAFPLRKWMMRPYSGRGLTYEKRLFNYRLSRARRTIENAFGVLAAK